MPHHTERAERFAAPPMAGLVDQAVRYDLAESTSPPLRLGELLGPDVIARLDRLELGYGTSPGDPALRALIADGLGVGQDDVLVTPGAGAALFLIAFVQCRPGDHAVVATPCFPPARTGIESLDVDVTAVPLSFDDGYRLDVAAIADALTPATRLVSVASPQNPSGIRCTEAELLALIDRIENQAPDAALLVDETYRESGHGATSVLPSITGLSPRIVTTASLSKSHGAPGLRIGWLATTDPTLRERLRIAKFNVLVGGSGVDELLATEVLRQREPILAARGAHLATALATLDRWASEHADAVEFLRPDGGALCCLRLRPDRYDDAAVAAFYAALTDRDIRVAHGSWFGESDHVFRLGFGHLTAEDFAAALDRLADAL